MTSSVTYHEIQGLGAPVSSYTSVVGVREGTILFVSGKCPVDENGKTISKDIEIQIRQVIKNMEAALKKSSATLENVVKLNAYFTLKECFPVWRKVRSEIFKNDFPASTAILVPGLAFDDWLVEIEAYAFVS